MNQPFKFKTFERNWVEIKDESRGVHDDGDNDYYDNHNIKFKTLMIRSSLCDYSDEYIPV